MRRWSPAQRWTKYGLKKTTLSSLSVQGRKVKAPVICCAGASGIIPLRCIWAMGASFAGRVGSGAGFNAYLIRTSDAPFYAVGSDERRSKASGAWLLPKATIRTTGRSYSEVRATAITRSKLMRRSASARIIR